MCAKTKSLRKNEEAVTPVIGTTLLVGMTVVMISAVAVSVLGFALPENAPHARIVIVEAKGDIGYTALLNNFIVLKHKGGEALFENNTRIIITGKGYTYTSGDDPHIQDAKDMRAIYRDLAGENCITNCDNEIVKDTSWDAGETITLYGSDGNDLYLLGWHNNADSRWKLDDGSTVSVTILDITTNEVIAVSQATVKQA